MSRQSTRRGRLVATAPVRERDFEAFESLAGRELNFQPISTDAAARDPDWHVDHRRVRLPAGPAGPPVAGGPFEAARQVLLDYTFADPAVVRAVYDPASEFDGRNMLLVGRFFGLRFPMGVRVGGVEEVATDGGRYHRFRWHYRTLEGHLERGHMDYELCKDLIGGRVEFRIRAYSQRAQIDSPIVRLGFALFGRAVQLRFYDRSLTRMQRFVAERQAGRAPSTLPSER